MESKEIVKQPAHTRINHEWAMRLWREGKNDVQIAAEVGASKSAVYRWRKINKLDQNRFSRHARTKEPESQLAKDIAEARRLGLTYGQYKAGQYLDKTEEFCRVYSYKRPGV